MVAVSGNSDRRAPLTSVGELTDTSPFRLVALLGVLDLDLCFCRLQSSPLLLCRLF